MQTADVFYKKSAFDAIQRLPLSEEIRLAMCADMIRHNSIAQVMVANTGHIGASLSAADTFAVLYHALMHVDPVHPADPDRDIFVLSKGHAAAVAYAALASRGFIPDEQLLTFRRLGGLQGHVDRETPGIEANTGALAMGISKAKGHAFALRRRGLSRRAYVMVGDGELQEGQNWEGLQSARALALGNLVVLVDKNAVQSDVLVDTLLPMPPLEEKLRAFGCEVHAVNGHDVAAVRDLLRNLDDANGVPKAVVLTTLKGKGVSFMEHPAALAKDGVYHWHNKVPGMEEYRQATGEIRERIERTLAPAAVPADFWPRVPESFPRVLTAWADDYVVRGYTKALLEQTAKREDIIVIDGDLAVDCGIRAIEEERPKAFLELGIAEQDMASVAGALAVQGFLPIVNTFSAFLSARANEQIFNNASEHSRVIYVGHLSGIIPATPGKSHQGVRDIGLIRTIPDIAICEPCSEEEAYRMTNFLLEKHRGSAYMRLANCKGLTQIVLPADYAVSLGKGFIIRDGKDVAIVTAGPIMLAQALDAAERLQRQGTSARVVHLPWHTDIDAAWLADATAGIERIVVVDNHVAAGGQSSEIRRLAASNAALRGKQIENISVDGFAETGQPMETLARFGLDGAGIAKRITS